MVRADNCHVYSLKDGDHDDDSPDHDDVAGDNDNIDHQNYNYDSKEL